jgi:hypothetical protein
MQSEEKVNILLVDDYPENLIALEAILESLGQNLVKAYSGKEALRCLLGQDFAVILLDVQMPGMDGFETATLIRERERSRHIPIIFLTAFGNDTLVFQGYALGAVDYLRKPIEPEILISKVTVFVDLFQKTAAVKRQAAQLTAINAELRTSEERFRSLSACSPICIFLTDIAGRWTYMNPRCQNLWAFKLEENSEANWLQSVHPEDQDWVTAEWTACIQAGQEYASEFRLQINDGTVRWIHMRSSPLVSDQSQLIGYVGTIEDITERLQAESARAQVIREQEARQQAETANQMKDEFLAVLSHELRTPLNAMLGWTRLLRTRKFDEVAAAQALETIERNAKLQAQLVEDILDVSRIIQGKLRLNLRLTNLVTVIEAAMDAVRLAAEAKAIQLKPMLDSSVPLVLGDANRLQQVIWNLLSNAIKFTPEGGTVEVRLEFVPFTTEQPASWTQIQVIDTGIGITPAFLPYIFDRFRQADSTTTRLHNGLGLGLSIVRHLVELHGGAVHAQSAGAEQGATFIVKLPLPDNPAVTNDLAENLASKATAAIATPTESELAGIGAATLQKITISGARPSQLEIIPSPPNLESIKILVVDDDIDMLKFLTTALEQYQAQVIAVTSAKEALAALEQFKPHILVSDIGMPTADGYELIRQVRALKAEQGGEIPAIALTAYASGTERSHILAAGFQSHMAKPVDPIELATIIANLVGRCCLLNQVQA